MRVLLVPNSKATIPAKLSVCHRFAVANKAIAVKMTATKLSASVENQNTLINQAYNYDSKYRNYNDP
ncbi:hypothetical protein WP50_31745, partial [Lactiplantibacillus plantarum]